MLIYYNTKNMMCGKTLTSFLSSLPRVVVHYCSVASLPLRMILSCHHVTSSEKMRKNGIFQKTKVIQSFDVNLSQKVWLGKNFYFIGKIGHFWYSRFCIKSHLTHICNFVRNSWKIYCKLQFSLSIKKKEREKKSLISFFSYFLF